MPSNPKLTYDEILKTLKDLPIFEDDLKRSLKKEKEDVWQVACNELNESERRINTHNLYIYVLQNRRGQNRTGILDRLKYIKFGYSKKKPNDADLENVEEICENEKIDTKVDEYQNLHKIAYGVTYNGIIKTICPRRFHLSYCLPEQESLCNDLISLNKYPLLLLVLNDIICNVTIKSYTSSDVFLIMFAMKVGNNTINLVQALSEKMESHFIISFCHLYLKSKISPPPKLVLGYSKILLNSTSFAFNCCSFHDYNLRCYFISKGIGEKPATILQVDILSLLLIINNKDCFANTLPAVKTFFMQCIIYLSTVDDFIDFEEGVVSLLILVLFPFQSESTDNHKSYWLSKINSHDAQKKYKIFKDLQNNQTFSYLKIQDKNEFHCFKPKALSELLQYVEELKLKVMSMDVSMKCTVKKEPNAYYHPLWFDDFFKELLAEFPAWTSIIEKNDFFDIIESCTLEHMSIFEKIQKPIIASEFLKFHIEQSKTLAQTGRSFIYELKHNTQQNEKPKNINSINHGCLNYQENWMGKNKVKTEDSNINKDETDLIDQDIDSHSLVDQSISTSLIEQNHDSFYNIDDGQNWLNSPKHSTPAEKAVFSMIQNVNTSLSIDSILLDHSYSFHPTASDVDASVMVNSNEETHGLLQESYACKNESNAAIHNIEFSSIKEEKINLIQRVSAEEKDDAVIDSATIHDSSTLSGSLPSIFDLSNANSDGHNLLSLPIKLTSAEERDIIKGIHAELESDPLFENMVCFNSKTSKSEISDASHEINLNIENFTFPQADDKNQNKLDFLPVKYSPERDDKIILQSTTSGMKDKSVINPEVIQGSNVSLSVSDTKNARSRKVDDEFIDHSSAPPPKKHKGLYVSPYPAMKLHHEQATNKTQKGPKDHFIRNGNGQAPKKVDKNEYVLRDTSVFDSLVTIVLFSYKYTNEFQTSCANESCFCELRPHNLCFFKLIINTAKAKTLDSFYKSRASFLLKFGTLDKDNIVCLDRSGELFSKLTNNHYCIKEKIHCKNCDAEYTYNRTLFKIFLGKTVIINNIEREIEESLQKTRHCKDCNDTAFTTYEFRNYVALDLEHTDYSTVLHVIPKQISLRNIKYILTGLTAYDFIDESRDKSKRTYIAYCRTIRDFWSKQQSSKSKAEDLNKMPRVNIALLFYVKIKN